jgi:hypothetical protein
MKYLEKAYGSIFRKGYEHCSSAGDGMKQQYDTINETIKDVDDLKSA